ncbi:hypothetical protein LSAT2_006762, partial [Lamellibrachia satsuma]
MVVDAAQQCAGFDEVNHTYDMPSQAIKSGQLLKKVGDVKLSQALERDTEAVEASMQFLKLCALQWSEVSATALRNLSERKRNGIKLLPLTEDVVKLNEYLDSEGNKQAIILDEHSDAAEAYATLIQLVLAKVITFNRKR